MTDLLVAELTGCSTTSMLIYLSLLLFIPEFKLPLHQPIADSFHIGMKEIRHIHFFRDLGILASLENGWTDVDQPTININNTVTINIAVTVNNAIAF